jgi:6-phosphogluconolactonase
MAPSIRRFADAAALAGAVAEDLAARIQRAIDERGECRLALAGGSSPRPVYERLADPDLSSGVDWTRTHVFWGDERCVPPDHDASNYRMADRALLSRVAIPTTNVHRILGERAPAEAARDYERVVGEAAMDVTLLGMGDDGHTASLFPDTAEPTDAAARVIATRSPAPPPDRVSMTYRALNESRAVWFLAAGANKAERVAEVMRQIARGAPVLPAARIAPTWGELVWYLDAAAAGRI